MSDTPMSDTNPLLQDWPADYGLPPFELVKPEYFEPALEQTMKAHREELDAIANNAQPPTFENTLAAFDRSGRRFSRVNSLFHNLCSSETSPELQAVQRKMAVPLAAHDSAMYMDAALFKRVDALYEER